MAAAQLCHVLQQLLCADNAAIEAGTHALQELRKTSATDLVAELIQVLGSDAADDVRQYAAVLLRQKVTAKWHRQAPDFRTVVKAELLTLVASAQSRTLLLACLDVVVTLSKLELADGTWPQLLVFLQQGLTAEEARHQEAALRLLAKLLDEQEAAARMRALFPVFCQVFSNLIQSDALDIVGNTLVALTALMPHVGTEEAASVSELLPTALAGLRRCVFEHSESADEAFDLLEEVMDHELPLAKPLLASMVHLALEVAVQSEQLSEEIISKALAFVHWALIRRAKTLAKKRLLEPILTTLFRVLLQATESFDTEEDLDAIEENQLYHHALEMLSAASTHVATALILPSVVPFVQAHVTAEAPGARRAAFDSITAILEGCSYFVRTTDSLHALLGMVLDGMQDASRAVRVGACVALTQMARECQPEVSEFHEAVLPRILKCVQDENAEVQSRACFALERFLEDLDEEAVPAYLPMVMELLNALTSMGTDAHQISISCLGALALSSKEAFAPYVEDVMEHLRTLFSIRDMDRWPLLCQAIDTAGVVATCSSFETLCRFADPFMALTMACIAEVDDPDVRVAAFALYGSFARVLEARFSRYLEAVVPQVLTSSRASDVHRIVVPTQADVDALTIHGNADDGEDTPAEGGSAGAEEAGEDEEGAFSGAVHVSELPEGEAAVQLLAALAKFCRLEFLPYFDAAYAACQACLGDDLQSALPGMRLATDQALTQLAVLKFASDAGSTSGEDRAWVPGLPVAYTVPSDTQALVLSVAGLLLRHLMEETEISMACELYQELKDLLEQVGPAGLADAELLQGLLAQIHAVLNHESAAQMASLGLEEDGPVEEDEEALAEAEILLMEYAGELLVSVTKALGPMAAEVVLPALQQLQRLATRRGATMPERNLAVGTLAELLEGLRSGVHAVQGLIGSVFASCLQDEDMEVRGNAFYGTGLLLEYGTALELDWNGLAELLLRELASEAETEAALHAQDNACGCGARLLLRLAAAKTRAFSPAQEALLAAIVQQLPLQQDLTENSSVFRLFSALAEMNHPSADALVAPGLSAAFALVLTDLALPKSTVAGVAEYAQNMRRLRPQPFQDLLATQSEEAQAHILAAVGLN